MPRENYNRVCRYLGRIAVNNRHMPTCLRWVRDALRHNDFAMHQRYALVKRIDHYKIVNIRAGG